MDAPVTRPEPDPQTPVGQLLLCIDQAWHSKSWHGSTFRGALSRVTPEMAAWRPGPGRPNIWEIVVHTAYWKHRVLYQLADPEPFPFRGSDWFPRPEGDVSRAAWKADLDVLGSIHRELRDAVAVLTAEELTTRPTKTSPRIDDLVRAVAFHDVHHGGQVQVLKKLWKLR